MNGMGNGISQNRAAVSGGNTPVQDYQSQLILLEQQQKEKKMNALQNQNSIGKGPSQNGAASGSSSDPLQDFQLQLMLLEQQDKKRMMELRQEHNNMEGSASPGGRPGQQCGVTPIAPATNMYLPGLPPLNPQTAGPHLATSLSPFMNHAWYKEAELERKRKRDAETNDDDYQTHKRQEMAHELEVSDASKARNSKGDKCGECGTYDDDECCKWKMMQASRIWEMESELETLEKMDVGRTTCDDCGLDYDPDEDCCKRSMMRNSRKWELKNELGMK